MSRFSNKTSVRSFVEQRILNRFPDMARVRNDPYSAGAQLIHPLVAAIEEVDKEIQKSVNQHFPLSVSPGDMDLLYAAPLIEGTNIYGVSGTNEYLLSSAEPNTIDSFWYDDLLDRIVYVDTNLGQKSVVSGLIAPTCRASSVYPRPSLYSRLDESYIVSTGTDEASVIGGTASAFTSGGYGDGPCASWNVTAAQILIFTDSNGTEINTQNQLGIMKVRTYGMTSPSTCLLMVGQAGGPYSTSSPIAIDDQWKTLFQYNFVNNGAVATTYPLMSLYHTAAAEEACFLLSDYRIINLDAETSSPYPLDGLLEEFPYPAYVTVSGATDLFDNATGNANRTRPTLITLKGEFDNNVQGEEAISPFHNGEHKSLHSFRSIYSISVNDLVPSTATVEVKLNHFRSTDKVYSPGNSLVMTYKDLPLFFGLEATSSKSFLQYQTFDAGSLADMAGGNDGISIHYRTEFKDHTGGDLDLIDIEVDSYNNRIWACSTNQIFLYDAEMPWATNLHDLESRTLSPDLRIDNLLPFMRYATSGESIRFAGHWVNHQKLLREYKWMLSHPNGTLYDLYPNGGTMAVNPSYWESNDDAADRGGRLKPLEVTYQATAYGDYAIYLIGVYQDDNTVIQETDIAIFSVPQKRPIWRSTSNPVSGIYADTQFSASSIYGIDLDQFGYLRIASTRSDSTALLNIARYRQAFDTYLVDPQSKKMFFREDYDHVEGRP